MIMLKEFILNLNKDTQFRVYLPNRDCLIYESFHSLHVTEPGILSLICDEDIYYINKKNQQYCHYITTMFYHDRSIVKSNYSPLNKDDRWIVFPWEMED